MMRIEMLYFAWVRERIGLSRERVETRAAKTVVSAAAIGAEYVAARAGGATMVVMAVNEACRRRPCRR